MTRRTDAPHGEAPRLDAAALGRSLRCDVELIVTLVQEGVLEPQSGDSPGEWRFEGMALRRACRAVRLVRDLDLNPPGVALALQLLDEIERLEAALGRAGAHEPR
jgi:chaperone modulatory protein CbpM